MSPLGCSLSRQLVLIILAAVSHAAFYEPYNFNALKHLGRASPYFELLDSQPASPEAPQGCTVTRASYLTRHGAINVNDDDYEDWIQPFLSKWANHTGTDWAHVAPLSFLADYKTPFPPGADTPEQVTKIGEMEAIELAIDITLRYPHLRVPSRVWASAPPRTFDSGKAFVRGLHTEDHPVDLVSVVEGNLGGANSLVPYQACTIYHEGNDEASTYRELFTKPIKARYNALAPAYNFTTTDIVGMILLCGYESVIRGQSPFCDPALFTPDERLGWEYADDIRYHYDVGYGNPLSGTIGFPWLNVTANMLMAESADEDIYVGISHRTLPSMVFVAMGLFNNSAFGGTAASINDTMPLDRINPRRAWRTSEITPCLGNLALERLSCTGSYGFDDGNYYRALVNRAPQALPGCTDGPGTSCSESGFLKFLQEREAMFGGFSERCQVDYDNSTDTVSFYHSI
ncbi:histidine acid phosphatase [Pseudomassariella vexata]|uniref:Histidine acid phosphatase n=1 Tax=Pseudomassariella vexata TaxID=1141098 RepID=A0A1Y2DFJ9_9PEZI|nr:histidine acid phosphatase [Pseudomassariella vexata]ORY57874.1 histidine acid phosphatase [Pseudomassariella vexata]